MVTHRFQDFKDAILTSDFILSLVREEIVGVGSHSVFGVNPQVGSTSFEDVWDAGGVLVYPTSGESWEIVSASGIDSSADIGARTVLVQYLDDSYLERSEVLSMSGVTPVPFAATDAFRFTRAIVLTGGSEAKNVGDITVRVNGGGAIRGQINSGNNNSLDGHYTVPAGHTAYLNFVYVNINKNEDIEMKLLSTIGDGNIFSTRFIVSAYQNSIVGNFPIPATFTEKSDIKLVAISSDVNAKAVGALQFITVNPDLTLPLSQTSF